jgi:hypothetical protein
VRGDEALAGESWIVRKYGSEETVRTRTPT